MICIAIVGPVVAILVPHDQPHSDWRPGFGYWPYWIKTWFTHVPWASIIKPCQICTGSIETFRLGGKITISFWDLTGPSATVLLRCLSNISVIRQFKRYNSQFGDFAKLLLVSPTLINLKPWDCGAGSWQVITMTTPHWIKMPEFTENMSGVLYIVTSYPGWILVKSQNPHYKLGCAQFGINQRSGEEHLISWFVVLICSFYTVK